MKALAIGKPVRYPVRMKAMTYTTAREKLADTIDAVCEDHDPVIITKRRDRSVVMIALDDYEALMETAYLLRSPRNARRLLSSINELREGKGKERTLLE
jgi:antitoxin YefM